MSATRLRRVPRPSPPRLCTFGTDARGATTVEFGIVASVLFTILFGLVDFGYAFWQWSSASKALELGVRLAAVSDPVSSDLKTMTGLSANVQDGDPMPYYQRVCSGASQTCSGGTFDQTALNTIVYGRGNSSCPATAQSYAPMCRIFSRIKPENVRIEYVHTGLGYAGRPGGPLPTIVVSLIGLNFDFLILGTFLGLAPIPMSGLTATATAEDLSGR
ncbi:MAG TPA: TadE/TadG family type IV pilus assembly protein [Beijerinckiaceae bacterium]|jgi:Flp pilus assembly protein TadG